MVPIKTLRFMNRLSTTPEKSNATLARMSHHDAVDAGWIVDQLRAEESFANVRSIHLELAPGNPERRDFGTRANFRVYCDKKPYCFLTLGRGLAGLWKRTTAFAKACPSLACRPLFRRRSGPWDLVGVEFFDGGSVESLYLDGSLPTDKALATIRIAVERLESTRQTSTVEAVAREFEAFANNLAASPLFSGFDQSFLREVVLPFVRSGAITASPTSRWTNGDFISRNLLINRTGDVRLIDHEFASRTHFAGDDWWRWKTFSRLPPDLRDIEGLRTTNETGDWLEVYFILRQFLLVHAINGAHLAVSDAQEGFKRIVSIIGEANFGFRSSAFLAAQKTLLTYQAQPVIEPTSVTAQLFWSTNGSFSEVQSKRIEFPREHETSLRFMVPSLKGRVRLRFDPVDTAGLVQISTLRVRRSSLGDACTVFHASDRWDQLHCGGKVMRLVDTPELNLLCLDDDPTIELPELEWGTEPTDLVLEAWVRFRRSLEILPHLLPQPAPMDQAEFVRLQAEAQEAQQRLPQLTHLQHRAEQELEARTAEVDQLKARVAERETRISQLEAAVQTSRWDLQNHLKTESEARKIAEAALDELRSVLAQKTAEADGLCSEVKNLKVRLEQRDQSIALLSGNAESAAAQATAEVAALRSENMRLQTQILAALESGKLAELRAVSLEAEVRNATEANVQLADHIRVAEARVRDLEQKHSELAESLHAQNALIQDLEQNADAAAALQNELSSRHEKEVQDLQSRLDALNRRPLARLVGIFRRS